MFWDSIPSTLISPVLSLALQVCSVYCMARVEAMGLCTTWSTNQRLVSEWINQSEISIRLNQPMRREYYLTVVHVWRRTRVINDDWGCVSLFYRELHIQSSHLEYYDWFVYIEDRLRISVHSYVQFRYLTSWLGIMSSRLPENTKY